MASDDDSDATNDLVVDLNDPDVEIDENGNVVGRDAPSMNFNRVPVNRIEEAKREAQQADADTDADADPSDEDAEDEGEVGKADFR